jgi:hypothetical protein
MDRHRQARDRDDPRPERYAGYQHDARHGGFVEPGAAVDAVARRSARQHREAEIVADRIARERCNRRRPPGQRVADHFQRDRIVEGQRDIANDGQPDRHRELRPAERGKRGAHFGQTDFGGQLVDRSEAKHRDDEYRQRD